MSKLHDLRRRKAALAAELVALATKAADAPEGMPTDDQTRFDELKAEIAELATRITRLEDAIAVQGESAEPVEASTDDEDDDKEKGNLRDVRRGANPTHAEPRLKVEKSLVIAGAAKMMAMGGNIFSARQAAAEVYGANHPVTKALNVSVGPSGGFIVPPDYIAEIVDLLRAKAVVRGAGAVTMPMPRGTLTLPKQTQAATAYYGAESTAIPASEQKVGQIVATYKKLTAFVPVTNDMMRYADPAVDTFVRNDLVKQLALREDLAFIRGDGTGDSPRGFLSFATGWNSGANLITSNPTFTLTTVAQEIGGAINKLETANVDLDQPCWFMHPRSKNYLLNVQNTVGAYVYRDEMREGKLLGYPFKTSTQIPVNLSDGSNSDCSEVYLVDMSMALILDSMSMELSASREGSYVDSAGATVSAFQSDQTLIRAITEHDFQMRQDAAIAVIKNVRWAPASA